MVVNAKDCYFENITFENSFGFENQAGPQALALYSITDKFTMNHCYLRSYQDTYLTAYSSIADRHYIKDTRIEGAVDFIYGGGDVFFDKDTITCTRATGGYIVAPSHGDGTAFGYVFSNCIINKSVVSSVTTYLGRPWQNAPKTVFINTKLGLNTSIYASGWYYKMGAIPAVFADYNTMDNAGNPVDLSQRISNYEYDTTNGTVYGTAKSSLTDQEAAAYTYENVILRSGDTWDPRLMAEAPNQPTNLQLSANSLTWDAVSYTRLYIVFRNNSVLGFTLNNQFTDATAVSGTNYEYTVQAVGEFGALSKLANPIQTLPLDLLDFSAKVVKDLSPKVNLTWLTANEVNTAKFDIERSSDGQIFNTIGSVESVNKSGTFNYSYTDKQPLSGYSYYRLNMIDLDGKSKHSAIKSIENKGFDKVSLYPNPVTNELYVNHPLMGNNAVIEILDMNSKKVISQQVQINSSLTQINTQNLMPGIYILIYKNDQEKFTTKFVKK